MAQQEEATDENMEEEEMGPMLVQKLEVLRCLLSLLLLTSVRLAESVLQTLRSCKMPAFILWSLLLTQPGKL